MEKTQSDNLKPKKRSNINDVAALAQVSIKTVSRVFNSEPNVRPKTREKVLSAARKLNYRPNLSARRLATNRSFVIGLLYDKPESDYVISIQEGSLNVCRERGYHLLIHPCSTRDPNFLDSVLNLYQQSTVDGYILTAPISEHEPLLSVLREREMHHVCISQRVAEGEPHVSVDDESAAFNMTEYLISLGHERIGFIMGHPEHGSSHDRLEGYRAAMKAHNLPIDPSMIEQGQYDFESGFNCARHLLSLSPGPTAIFASNDHMAVAVLTAAHEKRLEIPRDLSVCGFDDSPFSRYSWPTLTTMRQPIKEVARLATESLLNLIEEKEEPLPNTRLKTELIRRASTGPVKRQESSF